MLADLKGFMQEMCNSMELCVDSLTKRLDRVGDFQASGKNAFVL